MLLVQVNVKFKTQTCGHQRTDDRAHSHKFTVQSMYDCFEVIPLHWVWGLKNIKQAVQKIIIDVKLLSLSIKVFANYDPQQQLINDLKMGPLNL